MVKKIAIVTLLLLLIVAAGVPTYEYLTRETLDLEPLLPFAETESYEALIARINAQPIGPDGFSFVALGDTRTNLGRAREVLTQAATEKPVFMLSNGDVVRQGTVSEYVSHHMNLVSDIAPIPFIPVPGNHESGPNRDFAPFKAIYGDTQFSFDYGDCRFVGVNNSDRLGMSGDDLAFLEAELSKPGATHKFVTIHVPPRFMETYGDAEEGRGFWWNSNKFKKMMEKYDVASLFVGHVHGFYSVVLDGVRYTITGGAGAKLTNKLGEEGNVHNYVVVHVDSNGLRQEVVKLIDGTWVRSPIE